MVLTFFFFFCFDSLLQEGVLGRSHLPFLPTPEGIEVNDMVSRSLGLPDSNGVRRPRNAVSVLSLLWPQVVGPIENGIIKEEGYDEIPKTTLEQQLEGIRQKSKQQTLMRAHVRDLINHGAAPSQLTLQELYALNNEMGGYHPHPAHPLFHPLAHSPHPQGMPFFDSIVIQDSQLAPFPNDHRHPKKLIVSDTTDHPIHDNKHYDKVLEEAIKLHDITDFLNHFGRPISSDHKTLNNSVADKGDYRNSSKIMSLNYDNSDIHNDSSNLATEVNSDHSLNIDGIKLTTEVNDVHIHDMNFPTLSNEANHHQGNSHIDGINLSNEFNNHQDNTYTDGSNVPTEVSNHHSDGQSDVVNFSTLSHEANHHHGNSNIDGINLR